MMMTLVGGGGCGDDDDWQGREDTSYLYLHVDVTAWLPGGFVIGIVDGGKL